MVFRFTSFKLSNWSVRLCVYRGCSQMMRKGFTKSSNRPGTTASSQKNSARAVLYAHTSFTPFPSQTHVTLLRAASLPVPSAASSALKLSVTAISSCLATAPGVVSRSDLIGLPTEVDGPGSDLVEAAQPSTTLPNVSWTPAAKYGACGPFDPE